MNRKKTAKHLAQVENQDSEKIAAARDFVTEIIDAGEPWTDPDFAPCQDSVQIPGEKPAASR